MRTSQLITSYVQAVIFAALGVRCIASWLRDRDSRSAHLAVAAGLFGLQSAISAVQNTVYNTSAIPPETPPRWIGILTSILLFVAVYAFLLFLLDFSSLSKGLYAGINTFLIVATGFNILLSIIERPDLTFDPRRGIVDIPGAHNWISFRAYISYVLIYLAGAFAVLAIASLVYGGRAEGLARFRMLSIGSGFFLFFVVIGLLPRLLFGDPSAQTIRNLINIRQYVALLVAPLLFVGFAPPNFIKSRIPVVEVDAGTGGVAVQRVATTNFLAVASFILGLLGASVLALIFGYVA